MSGTVEDFGASMLESIRNQIALELEIDAALVTVTVEAVMACIVTGLCSHGLAPALARAIKTFSRM